MCKPLIKLFQWRASITTAQTKDLIKTVCAPVKCQFKYNFNSPTPNTISLTIPTNSPNRTQKLPERVPQKNSCESQSLNVRKRVSPHTNSITPMTLNVKRVTKNAKATILDQFSWSRINVYSNRQYRKSVKELVWRDSQRKNQHIVQKMVQKLV